MTTPSSARSSVDPLRRRYRRHRDQRRPGRPVDRAADGRAGSARDPAPGHPRGRRQGRRRGGQPLRLEGPDRGDVPGGDQGRRGADRRERRQELDRHQHRAGAVGGHRHARSSAVNDADAAGVAEMVYGAGRGQHGVVLMTTFGTGIGTAVFLHGQLLPNTEFGHIEIDGKDAEKDASEIVREKKGLSWAKWAKRVDRYLRTAGSPVLAGHHHHRRRREPEGRQVHPAAEGPGQGRAGDAAERRRASSVPRSSPARPTSPAATSAT